MIGTIGFLVGLFVFGFPLLVHAAGNSAMPSHAAVPAAVTSDSSVYVRGRLMWAIRDNGRDVSWWQAKAFADSCTLAGFDDWRLPTVRELATLAGDDEREWKTPAGATVASVRVVAPIELSSHLIWSANVEPGKGATLVDFSGEYALWTFSRDLSRDARVLCVRNVVRKRR